MRQIIMFTFICLASTALFAAAPTITEAQYKRTGGYILKPGTLKGTIKILNSQDKISKAELKTIIVQFNKLLNVNIVLEEVPFTSVETAKDDKNRAKANVAVYVVDSQKLPLSLVSLEERWGLVNLSKMNCNGNPLLQFSRMRCGLLRVFALVCGAGMSQYPGSALGVGDAPEDWDASDSNLPIDALNRMATSLKNIGVTRAEYHTYIRACREGWAPAPTNDIQKAIWDKLHTIPKNPMKIEFDPKKGR